MAKSTEWEKDFFYVDKIPHDDLIARGFHRYPAGRHRIVYRFPSGNYVIKFPMNRDGEKANQEEANLYSFYKDKPQLRFARCRLFKWKGVSALVMEYVERPPYIEPKKKPYWTCQIDNGQYGYNRSQRLVAYDYSDI